MGRLRILLSLAAAAVLPLGVAPQPADAASPFTVTAIAAGTGSTCAVTSGGRAICWGYGPLGDLGSGLAVTSLAPVGVAGLTSGVRAIATGRGPSCALTSGGAVSCWGLNVFGQAGSKAIRTLAPVAIPGLETGVSAIAAGAGHTCALRIGGGVQCWGSNYQDQLADGSRTTSATPVDIPGLTSGVAAIAAGWAHTCALTSAGGVKCWGGNHLGQLGNGSKRYSDPVRDVIGLTSGVTAISAGFFHTCAVTRGGGVKCWGYNSHGELGDGSLTASVVPVQVSGLTSGVIAIAAGGLHTCALLADGRARCWGSNRDGQLGTKSGNSRVPLAVQGLPSAVRALSAGGEHTCAVTNAGGALCWGSNLYGQLGTGTRIGSRSPAAVDLTIHQVIQLDASVPAGTIPPGTAVTFGALIAPLGTAGERGTVRFEIFVEEGGVRRLSARRDMPADATGRATLRWTFVTTGSRSVRARALDTAMYAASPWSPLVRYSVGGS